MFHILNETIPSLESEKPRYLMGVGKPDDIIGSVLRGIDMFDCVMPTRSGRTGQAFTRRGTINIRNARHQDDGRSLDEQCSCIACTRSSRAYLHHLFRSNEILGPIFLTAHNMQYYQDLMLGLRQAIEHQTLAHFINLYTEDARRGDIEVQ